ncbi:hypothetical protein ACKKBG_A17230 [Auxenochlorella protothecoides x Auxenochlorella symbiontica]
MAQVKLGVVLRAMAAGALALGSKSAAVAKGAGGVKTLLGLTAAGGAVAAVTTTAAGDQEARVAAAQPRIPSHAPPPPRRA